MMFRTRREWSDAKRTCRRAALLLSLIRNSFPFKTAEHCINQGIDVSIGEHGVGDDGPYIGPAPIDRRLADPSPRSDPLHSQAVESQLRSKFECRFENALGRSCVSWSTGGLFLILARLVPFHCWVPFKFSKNSA